MIILLAIVGLSLGQLSDGIEVTSLRPGTHMHGGVTLTITGNGFSEDQFNYFDSNNGNQVFLGNSVEIIGCPIVNYKTTSTQIVCISDPRLNNEAPVKYDLIIFVDGVRHETGKILEYHSWVAPSIDGITPLQAAAPSVGVDSQTDGILTVKGSFHTDKIIHINKTNPDESVRNDLRAIAWINLDEEPCNTQDETTGVKYGIQTSHQISCKPTSTTVGGKNISMYVPDRGHEKLSRSSLFVDHTDTLYQVFVYPTITDISPKKGSAMGGTLITISGTGFDRYQGATEVFIGGASCKIVDMDAATIKCLTPKKEDTNESEPGGRGIVLELWNGEVKSNISHALDNLDQSHPSYSRSILPEGKTPVTAPSVGRLSTFFTAPHNGDFRFELKMELKNDEENPYSFFAAKDGNPQNAIEEDPANTLHLLKGSVTFIQFIFIISENDTALMQVVDFNVGLSYSDANNVQNPRHIINMNPSSSTINDKYLLSISNIQGPISFHLNSRVSKPVDSSDTEEVKSAVMSLFDQECEVIGNVKDRRVEGFEDDANTFRTHGRFHYDMGAYCGKRARMMDEVWKQWFHAKEDLERVDVFEHSYFCFALKGDVQKEIQILYYWIDTRGRNRWDYVPYNVTLSETAVDGWHHQCINTKTIALESEVIVRDGRKAGSPIFIIRIFGMKAILLQGVYVVDQLSFDKTENFQVMRTVPPALKDQKIKNVIVDKSSETEDGTFKLKIEYRTTNCLSNYPLLGVTDGTPSNALVTELLTADSYNFSIASGYVFVERLRTAEPVEGTFDLTIEGETIEDIPYDTDPAGLREMIDNAVGRSGHKVLKRGDCDYTSYYIEWLDNPGPKELITVNEANMNFSSDIFRSWIDRNSSLTHNPIQNDFLRTHNSKEDYNEAVLIVDGVTGACTIPDCSFEYENTDELSLTSYTKTFDESSGHTLTILGSGFTSNSLDDYGVNLGSETCVVTSVTSPGTLVCVVDHLPAGTFSIDVRMQPTGSASHPDPALSVSVSLSLTSISPETGGSGGGFHVEITGTGLPRNKAEWENNNVAIGSADCELVDATLAKVTCIVPPGTKGTADVTVSVNGSSNTMTAGFEYDDALSGSISSISQTSASPLGGEKLTISGSGFGAEQLSSHVMIGAEMVEVENWSDTSIKVTLPTLTHGHHKVTVFVNSTGYARGSQEIQVKFVVNSLSPTQGSLYGGTILHLTGEGFGGNCSLLKVSLGKDVVCDIIDCSDTEIICKVRLVPKRHVSYNTGIYPGNGPGTAWKPKKMSVKLGATVSFVWNKINEESKLKIAAFQTSSAISSVYNEGGITSGSPTSNGQLSFTCNTPGPIFIATNPIYDELVLRAQVNCDQQSEDDHEVILTIGDQVEAHYEPKETVGGTTLSTDVNNCNSIVSEALSDCIVNGTVKSSNGSHLSFSTKYCLTPTITKITPSSVSSSNLLSGTLVTAGVTLTINGNGFGTMPCQNEVKIGDATCSVSSSTENSIVCQLTSQENLESVYPHPVAVTVANRGKASDATSSPDGTKITILPVLTSISPIEGSVAGGTLVKITGSGLKAFDGVTEVLAGSRPCLIQSVTSTIINCITSKVSSAKDVKMKVKVSANLISASGDITYSYSDQATPTVSSFTLTGRNAAIQGSNFGNDPSKVKVTLRSSPARYKRSSRPKRGEHTLHSDEHFIPESIAKNPDSPHSGYHSNIHSDIFEDIKSTDKFWSKFLGTPVKSFEDSLHSGIWRHAGSKKVNQPNTTPRDFISKREASEEETEYECQTVTATDTAVSAICQGLHSGSFSFDVKVDGVGTALVSSGDLTSVTSAAVINDMTPTEGSTEGGALLSLTGEGFVPLEISIKVGDSNCVIESETTTSITCRTPPLDAGVYDVVLTSGGVSSEASKQFTSSTSLTPAINSVSPDSGLVAGTSMTIAGTNLQVSNEDPEVMIGDFSCDVTSATTSSVTCTISDVVGGTQNVWVRTNSGNSNSASVTGVMSVGSVDPTSGGFGGVEIDISGSGFNPAGEVTITVCGETCSIPENATISSSSLTCLVPPKARDGSPTVSCDITVTNPGGRSASLANGFTYDDSETPEISGISPKRGGTAGGTKITITGSGFGVTGNVVTIGGSKCVIQTETTTEIICQTEEHEGSGKYPLKVEVPNTGNAVLSNATSDEDVEFQYVDVWSSIYSWGGKPIPGEGEFIVIGEGQTILIDQSTPVLKMLLIKGGNVVFDDEAKEEIVLRAEYILIVDGGSFSIGTEDDPFPGEAVVELYGSHSSIELPNFGAKVLAVRNGTLDIHGKPVFPTWTHLAETAPAGQDYIVMKQSVSWKAGDVIIIASTEFRFGKNENEKCTIKSVSNNGTRITCEEPLKYEHISIEQIISGRIIETRAEVGLLTRNVKVRGSVNVKTEIEYVACDDEFNTGQFAKQTCLKGRFGAETENDNFGVTIMMHSKNKSQDIIGRLSFVEIHEAGQASQLGRYPVHYHLVGDMSHSFVRGCSIHNTYNRAVTMHAVNSLLVEHNVAYNIMGMAYFTEDGNEKYNRIRNNLAVYVRSSNSLLNPDVTPACFWIVNPENTVTDNACAGSSHFGYWYNLQRHPTGPSSTTSMCPMHTRMGEFRNNSAHSLGWYGLWIFSGPGYFAKSGECWGSHLVSTWYDFHAWFCERGAEAVNGGYLKFVDFVTLDNLLAGIEMVEVKDSNNMKKLASGVIDSLVVGHSALSPNGCRDSETTGVVGPKKGLFTITNTTFVNFNSDGCTAIGGCSQCMDNQSDTQTMLELISAENVTNMLKFLNEYETIYLDIDGSLTGKNMSTIVPTQDTLPDDCIEAAPSLSINPKAKASVCSSSRLSRLTMDQKYVMPETLHYRDLQILTENGNMTCPFELKRIFKGKGWMCILPFKETYIWNLQQNNLTYTVEFSHVKEGDYLYVQHIFPESVDYVSTGDVEKNSSESIPDPETSFHGDYYIDSTGKEVTYIVKFDSKRRRKRASSSNDDHVGESRKIEFNAYRCKFTGCVAPTAQPDVIAVEYKWSELETWSVVDGGSASGNYFPTAGKTVTIPREARLLVDTETPQLGPVYVYGALEFVDGMDHDFEASLIYIQGGEVKAGSEESPFMSNLNIRLRGDASSNNIEMPPGTVGVGAKAIGVFGKVELYGQGSGSSYIKLGATAAAGDSQITLASTPEPDFLDNQVVVTTSGKDINESEIRTVTGISGNVITLDSPLEYEHLGVTHTLANGKSYTLAAEVGLLGRNIVIEGSETDDLFGGRVIVSEFTDYRGSVKLENVEFRNMGQYGIPEGYSLSFDDLNDNNGENIVKRCAFNINYNTAIGVVGSNGILFENNVIHHTVGSGIIDEGISNIYKNNLVATMYFPGTYGGRFEEGNLVFSAGFHLNDATSVVLEGNTVAGTEQAGYMTYGEMCEDESNWSNNEVHSAMFGVLLWKVGKDKGPECRRLKNFYAWRVWDTAFYMQHYASLEIAEIVSVDNRLATNQLVYGPEALSHKYADKTATVRDSIIVGASPSHTCQYHNSRAAIKAFFKKSLLKSSVNDGVIGIMLQSHMSLNNMAPKHQFVETSSYPTLYGSSYIINVLQAHFKNRTCGSEQISDYAIMTNPDSEDAIHPIFTQGLEYQDTDEGNKLRIHNPSVNSVNPSDCVDMSCDGHKKVVIQDWDGTLTGAVNGTIISRAEYEWNGDPAHGFGEYRIPVPMRLGPDGVSFVDAKDKYPNAGIFRNNDCDLKPSWNAWQCTGISHRMMVLESMDSDTEIRRLSPIAILADGFIDLLNGPMDRGWCFGYTCQERISTFYAIIAMGHTYDITMTSTPPQNIRLHVLNSDPSESVLLKLYFPKLQRYDVLVNGILVPPTNIDNDKFKDGAGSYQLKDDSESNSAYQPDVNDPVGSNYLKRDEKLLYIVSRGGYIIDIKTKPTILLNMGLVIDPDNFFEENIVENLAALLGIDKRFIRVMNAIREGSKRRRKKRASAVVTFVFEIASTTTETQTNNTETTTVTDVVNATVSSKDLTYEDLLDAVAKVTTSFQTECGDCNFTIKALEVSLPVAPPPAPEDIPDSATQEQGAVILNGTQLFSDLQQMLASETLKISQEAIVYKQPEDAQLNQDVPSEVAAFTIFQDQPIFEVLSTNGSVIKDLGHISDPWMVSANLSGGTSGAQLLGDKSVPYINGKAEFTNLAIDKPGTGYSIDFSITYPITPVALTAVSKVFNVNENPISLDIAVAPEEVAVDEVFSITVQLINSGTSVPMVPSVLEGQQMTVTVDVNGQQIELMGNTSFTLYGGDMASFEVTDLYFDKYASIYSISVTGNVEPAGWNLVATESIQGVVPDGGRTVKVTMTIESDDLAGNEVEFGMLIKNKLQEEFGTQVQWDASVQNGLATVDITGDDAFVTHALMDLCNAVSSSKLFVDFKGTNVYLKNVNIYIDGEHRLCQSHASSKHSSNVHIEIIQKIMGSQCLGH